MSIKSVERERERESERARERERERERERSIHKTALRTQQYKMSVYCMRPTCTLSPWASTKFSDMKMLKEERGRLGFPRLLAS